MLTRFLTALGVVRTARYAALHQKLEKAVARAEQLEQAMSQMRAELRDAKARREKEQVAVLERQAAQEVRHTEQLARIKADLGAHLESARARVAEFQVMRTRLADAAQETAVGRDHLMAIEVKLDILEGAANVLDRRTRAARLGAERETGARS